MAWGGIEHTWNTKDDDDEYVSTPQHNSPPPPSFEVQMRIVGGGDMGVWCQFYTRSSYSSISSLQIHLYIPKHHHTTPHIIHSDVKLGNDCTSNLSVYQKEAPRIPPSPQKNTTWNEWMNEDQNMRDDFTHHSPSSKWITWQPPPSSSHLTTLKQKGGWTVFPHEININIIHHLQSHLTPPPPSSSSPYSHPLLDLT